MTFVVESPFLSPGSSSPPPPPSSSSQETPRPCRKRKSAGSQISKLSKRVPHPPYCHTGFSGRFAESVPQFLRRKKKKKKYQMEGGDCVRDVGEVFLFYFFSAPAPSNAFTSVQLVFARISEKLTRSPRSAFNT